MTSRRCIVLEEGVRELLELNHYTIHIVPVGYNKNSPPAHLVASREPDETRYIRIKKVSRRSRTTQESKRFVRVRSSSTARCFYGLLELPGCTANSGSTPFLTGIVVLRC